MINQIKHELSNHLPTELVEALLDEYKKLKENFLLGRHEPSELDAGKFCEVVVRIIQFETSQDKKYLSLSTKIPNFIDTVRKFEGLPANVNTSHKLHIPRVLIALYNIRNHRGVGHIGGDVNPNTADANFLVMGCDWILAELFRIYFICSLDDAEKIIQKIVKRKNILVYDFGNRKRVLKVKDYESRILLLLDEEFPNRINENTLFTDSEHSHSTTFKKILKKMHKDCLIDYHKGSCVLLPAGIDKAEDLIINNK